MSKSAAEERFLGAWRETCAALPEPVREHRFHPTRQWRFDFAWPDLRIAVEIDGRGRHQTVDGARKDMAKHNAAVLLGWRVLRFPATDKAEAIEWAITVAEVMCFGESPISVG